jgi:serine/threonine-protein kinase
VLAVLGVFVAAAILAKALFSNSGGAGIATPSVVGLTQTQAESAIQAKGLRVGRVSQAFIGENNCNQPKGLVCDQSPVGGIALNKDSAVSLTISKGAQQVQVPSLVKLSQSDATKALAAAHLAVGVVTPQDSLNQSLPPGQTVDVGTKVNLTVASGNAALPNVFGQDVNAATNTLQQAGFRVAVKQQPTADPNQLNKVLAQSPNGSTARAGSTITITVGAPPPTPTPTPTPTPPTTGPFPP